MAVPEPTEIPLDVRAVHRLSPSLVRVQLGAPPEFASLDAPDEAAVFRFPGEPLANDSRATSRWYTLRRVEQGLLTVDILLHEGGVGGTWAAQAAVGEQLVVTHRNSWYRRPAEARWQLLVGDVAALPAIGRIIDETASTLPTAALVEIPHPDDAQDLPGVTWVHNPGLAAGSDLERLVRQRRLPEGPGYVYVAGEAAATRAVRRHLRHELALPATAYGVIGYWRIATERWLARVADSGVDTAALYAAASAGTRDEEEAMDAYEHKLAEAGLL